MSIKRDRLAEVIREIAGRHLIHWSEIQDHAFGIVGIIDVVIAPDRSYADIYLGASGANEGLIGSLSHTTKDIQHEIGKELRMRKNPHVRFKIKKESPNKKDISSLIDELSKQYDLTK